MCNNDIDLTPLTTDRLINLGFIFRDNSFRFQAGNILYIITGGNDDTNLNAFTLEVWIDGIRRGSRMVTNNDEFDRVLFDPRQIEDFFNND